MKFGTATWIEGGRERRTLVSVLDGAPDLLVDLNRVEQVRLAKLGEGQAESLAELLVPGSLRRVLEGGPRALHRAAQCLAYAEKWRQRGTLPESFVARPGVGAKLLPCLPRPNLIRLADGNHRDRLQVKGPGTLLKHLPRPAMAAIGMHGGKPAGFCLALEDGDSTVLGAWMHTEWPSGDIELLREGDRQIIPFGTWTDLALPVLRPGEVLLLPPPLLRLKPLPGPCTLIAPFERMVLELEPDASHPTIQ